MVGVANLGKHQRLLKSLGTGKFSRSRAFVDHTKLIVLLIDLLVDRTDLGEAKRLILKQIPSSLRFAIDVVGGETASWCQEVLEASCGSNYSSPNISTPGNSTPNGSSTHGGGWKLGHLVTLTGAPKASCSNVQVHQVPIKLFHTHQKIGGHLSKWLCELLDKDSLILPEVEFVDGGLGAVNDALERLKDGTVSGKRLVVRTKEKQTSA